MAELVEACDALMDDDLAARMVASAVASSCEIYTVEELQADGRHDVYPLRLLDETLVDARTEACVADAASACNVSRSLVPVRYDSASSTLPPADVLASLDDSVLDLKRHLERSHPALAGLSRRPRNREGVAACWELVFRGSALSYHLFLHDYGLAHGDVLHAVVRKE